MASKQGRGDDALERIAEHVEKVAGQVRWLAYQLSQAGIAEDGLAFAIETLGSERVKREVEQGPPFGVRCRGRAAFATDPDELAAWTILSACEPGVVSRRWRPGGTRSGLADGLADVPIADAKSAKSRPEKSRLRQLSGGPFRGLPLPRATTTFGLTDVPSMKRRGRLRAQIG